MDQHDLHQDGLLAELPQGLDVVTHVAPQPPGPALLEEVLEGGVTGGVGHVGKGVVGAELGLITDAAAFSLEKLSHLQLGEIRFFLWIFYHNLLRYLRYRLEVVVDFLSSEVNVKFEVESEVDLVTLLVRNQLRVVPDLHTEFYSPLTNNLSTFNFHLEK